MMSSSLDRRQPWHGLAARIRCGLSPDEPRLLTAYLAEGQSLVQSGALSPWEGAQRSLALLMQTASDPELPLHWRHICLDHACRPLEDLARCARDPFQRQVLETWRWRLAHLELGPAQRTSDVPPPIH